MMPHPSEHSNDEPVARYALAGPDYLRAGWQPLILPPCRKEPPPAGFTGENGRQIGSVQTVKQWARQHPDGNLALHLLHPLVGIDVDTYADGGIEKSGAATLAAAEADLGPLPPTIISSSRPDPELSGIRLFRLPKGYARATARSENNLDGYGREVTGDDGKARVETFIDVISCAHRYVVAWPSVHPDTGAPYRWWRQTADGLEVLDGVPDRDLITELPPAWAERLVGRAGAGAGSAPGKVIDLPVSPFDPAQADLSGLDDLGIDVASRKYNADGERASLFGVAAHIERHLAAVRNAPMGRGEPTVNAEFFAVGQIVAAHPSIEDDVRASIEAAFTGWTWTAKNGRTAEQWRRYLIEKAGAAIDAGKTSGRPYVVMAERTSDGSALASALAGLVPDQADQADASDFDDVPAGRRENGGECCDLPPFKDGTPRHRTGCPHRDPRQARGGGQEQRGQAADAVAAAFPPEFVAFLAEHPEAAACGALGEVESEFRRDLARRIVREFRDAPRDEDQGSAWWGPDEGDDEGDDLVTDRGLTLFRPGDSRPCLYPASWHIVMGLTGSGKTWWAAASAREIMYARCPLACPNHENTGGCDEHPASYGHVVYIHGEENTPKRIRARLRKMGVDEATIARQFHFLRKRRHTSATFRAALAELPRAPRLSVMDGINALCGLHGWAVKDTEAVSAYRETYVHPATETGCSVVSLGHQPKAKDRQNDRHAFGSTAWTDEVDGAVFKLEAQAKTPLRPGSRGYSRLVLTKDRDGHLHEIGIPDDEEAGIYDLGSFELDSTGEHFAHTVARWLPPRPAEGGEPGHKRDKIDEYADKILVYLRAIPAPEAGEGDEVLPGYFRTLSNLHERLEAKRLVPRKVNVQSGLARLVERGCVEWPEVATSRAPRPGWLTAAGLAAKLPGAGMSPDEGESDLDDEGDE